MRLCLLSEAHSLHTRRWATALSRHGCEVHVVSPTPGSIPGAVVHHQPMYTEVRHRQLANTAAVRRIIARLGPDVVCLFGLFCLQGVLNMPAALGLSNLVAVAWGSDIVAGDRPLGRLTRFATRNLLYAAARVVTSSHYLAHAAGVLAPRLGSVDVIHWGVDIGRFAPSDARDKTGPVRIGFAKRLHCLSAPDDALTAFAQARDRAESDLVLDVAGAGPMEEELHGLARELKIESCVNWRGWVDEEGLPQFFRQLDLLVMPSRREALGVAAIEAMASGVPVVATRVGGIPEVVAHGTTGLLVPPGKPRELCRALVQLADDVTTRQAMGVAARERVEASFDFEDSVRQIKSLFQQVARTRRSGRAR